ncbi:MAG: hypothetical protein GYB68_18470 [Chloroflexi bacterium]|nr:hypothetical protein [Chloroflexota bacterium]
MSRVQAFIEYLISNTDLQQRFINWLRAGQEISPDIVQMSAHEAGFDFSLDDLDDAYRGDPSIDERIALILANYGVTPGSDACYASNEAFDSIQGGIGT